MERRISSLCLFFLTLLCDFSQCLSSNALLNPAVVQVQCTNRLVSLTLKTDGEFNGVLYAGLHNKECRMLGKGQKRLDFSLPVKQCGIVTIKSPTDANKVIHKIQIYIQHHPMLQMEKDQRLIEECTASADPSAVGEGIIADAANSVEVVAPAWMEIVRGAQADGPKIRGPVVLGETISLLTKVNTKPGQDAMVTRCLASDGTESEPEKLIDDDGCPTDKSIVPAFAKISTTTPVTLWTKFPAFKFPDRQRLYLTCQVVVCDGTCPQPRCSRKTRQSVSPSDGWKPANQVTQLDVANSVQVVNSDLEGKVEADPYALEEKDENRICWPLKNLMTAIGILAAILLIALILAVCFWWSRRQRQRKNADDSYGTQTNSLYNPSTNYYYMDQYGDSQQYSGANGQSVNGRSQTGSQQPPRVYRDTSH